MIVRKSSVFPLLCILSVGVSGCAADDPSNSRILEIFDRHDGVKTFSGNAAVSNVIIQTKNPWPKSSFSKKIYIYADRIKNQETEGQEQSKNNTSQEQSKNNTSREKNSSRR